MHYNSIYAFLKLKSFICLCSLVGKTRLYCTFFPEKKLSFFVIKSFKIDWKMSHFMCVSIWFFLLSSKCRITKISSHDGSWWSPCITRWCWKIYCYVRIHGNSIFLFFSRKNSSQFPIETFVPASFPNFCF